MAKKSITEVPFLEISRDNMVLVDKLTPQEKYELMDAMADYFLRGLVHDFSENRIMDFVWTAFFETFNRRVVSYNNSIEAGTNNFKRVNEERKAKKQIIDKETGEIIE